MNSKKEIIKMLKQQIKDMKTMPAPGESLRKIALEKEIKEVEISEEKYTVELTKEELITMDSALSRAIGKHDVDEELYRELKHKLLKF